MNPHLIPDPKGLSLLLYFLQCWLLFEIALIMLFFHNNEFFFFNLFIFTKQNSLKNETQYIFWYLFCKFEGSTMISMCLGYFYCIGKSIRLVLVQALKTVVSFGTDPLTSPALVLSL